MHLSRREALLAGLLAAPAAALAQESASPLVPDAITLDPVVLSAGFSPLESLSYGRASTTLQGEDLRERGILVQLDDFGTGFSALSYLHRFPIHALKIDQSFVAGLDDEMHPESLALVRAILALAGTLGIDTIAEGVETQQQRDLLDELGCQYGQGFLYGRPAPDPVARIAP